MLEGEVRQIIRDELKSLILLDKYTFQKNIQIFDNRHIQLGKTNGTKIGTEATQKIGFLSAAPVVRQAKINDPAGGATVDAQSRGAINEIINVLEAFGFTASS
jgi:hypothetical protein